MIERFRLDAADRRWWLYAVAIALALGTWLLGGTLRVPGGEAGELLLILPIMVAAYLGGLGPGLLATGVAAVGASGIVLGAGGRHNGVLASLEWVTLVLSGVTMSLLCESLHRSHRRMARRATGLALTEAALRKDLEEGEELARIAQLAPGVIYSFRLAPDGSSSFPYASPSIGAIFGLDPATLAGDGEPVFQLMAPEDAERIKAAISESARTLEPWQDEFRIVRPDGVRWLSGHSVPRRDPDGGTVWTGFVSDITGRRTAEAGRRESEERLAAIVSSARDGIITVGPEQRIELVNPAAEAMFGYPADALLGQPIDRLLPERFRARHRQQIEAFVPDGAPAHQAMGGAGGVAGLRANGEEFPLEATVSRSMVSGRPLFTVLLRDLTERRRVEEAVKAGETRFRQLAEAIKEVFWMIDPATGEMIYVSPAYEGIWGRTCESLYHHPGAWFEAIHPEDRERVREAAGREAQPGGYDVEYRVVRPDGTIRWIHDRAFPVRDDDGRVVRVAGVAEDVTVRRELEQQLAQTQKMESIGQLAGGVAHDFNNLLTVIASSADLLRSDLDADSPSRPFVDDIVHAGKRAASLTRQLLAFSRQEVVEPRVVDLADVVSDTEKMLQRLIGEDIALSTVLDACPVRIDPGQWTQVLLNLAVNARDAMPKGGQLAIATRFMRVDETFVRTRPQMQAGPHAVLTVRDTGSGMTPEVLRRAFEPFFTTKPRGQGTGLGLAVIYGIVLQSGGHIEVDSAVGRGTTFTIYLPLVSPGAGGAAVPAAAAGAAGGERILLVEDEEMVRRVALRVLQSKGYHVTGAVDGQEALRLVQDGERFDLLLTDVVMPVMDGPDLVAATRECAPGLRVLFTSGYLDDAVVRRGIKTSEVAFLQKPYSAAALLRRVREVLDGGAAARPLVA